MDRSFVSVNSLVTGNVETLGSYKLPDLNVFSFRMADNCRPYHKG